MARHNARPAAENQGELERAFSALEAREREVLKIYRPFTKTQQRIHESPCLELICKGGKRAGKTIPGLVEFARRILGQPITGINGEELPSLWPCSTPEDPKRYWVIGWDWKHIGQTLYPKMFEPGLLRCIRDKKTKKWRLFNEADPEDMARYKESVPSEPLFPPRLIIEDSWDWYTTGSREVKSLRLKNGAMICFYPSSSQSPKQGDDVHGVWIDEDIQHAHHLDEFQDRGTKVNGWFLWTVWPHVHNYALMGLLDRAAEQEEEDSDKRDIEAITLLMSENPTITKQAKDRAFRKMGSEEAIARRDRGDLLLDDIAMYDYAREIHRIQTLPARELAELPKTRLAILSKIFTELKRFPYEWTRYLSIDPSHYQTAVIFGVVPPPEIDGVSFEGVIIVEDELIARKATSEVLAKAVKQKIGSRMYEAFIMDKRMGRATRVGAGDTVFHAYTKAFQAERIVSRITKSGFIPGLDKPARRYLMVRQLMGVDDSGDTRFFICEHCTATIKEFTTYRKKQQRLLNGEMVVLDEPANPRIHDAMAGVEYLVAYVTPLHEMGIAYIQAEEYRSQGSPAYHAAQRLLKFQNSSSPYVHLGPGAVA